MAGETKALQPGQQHKQQVVMDEDRITIAVVPREQFHIAPHSLDSIYANTDIPFRLVYVDGNSPPTVQQHLQKMSRERGFQLLRSERYLSPNCARNWAMQYVRSEYVLFIDNDVLVEKGWLQKLLTCAEETGAWAVGPLYLEGQLGSQTVHMAGGTYAFTGSAPNRSFVTEHLFQGQQLPDVRPRLERTECDFIEFHCMLVRSSVFEQLGPLDENLLNTREHLDLCLKIRDAGGCVYFEPDAIAHYHSPPPLMRGDIPYFMLRWSEKWTRSSLEHFVNKYGISGDYVQRSVIAASRRAIVFDPLTRFLGRIVGKKCAHLIYRVLSRLERLSNRLWIRDSDGSARLPS